MPCGCSDDSPQIETAPIESSTLDSPPDGAVMLEYQGDSVSVVFAGVEGAALSSQYYFGSIIHNPQMSRRWVRVEDARRLLTVADGKGPLFQLVEKAKPMPPEVVTVKAAPQDVERPQAPRMSEIVTSRATRHSISDMTLDDLRDMIADTGSNQLAAWLAEEQAGKGRKGIITALTKTLSLTTGSAIAVTDAQPA